MMPLIVLLTVNLVKIYNTGDIEIDEASDNLYTKYKCTSINKYYSTQINHFLFFLIIQEKLVIFFMC